MSRHFLFRLIIARRTIRVIGWWASSRTSVASPMKNTASLLVALGMLAGACASREDGRDDVPPDGAAAEARWTVGLESVGPVTYGMKLAEARTAAGDSLAGSPLADECAFVRLPGMPMGMQLMTEGGRIMRVDVTGGESTTDRGARLGMREEEVQSLYGAGLEVRPHKYDSAGHYLVLAPETPDSLRLVFETDGQVVTRYRAGLLPAVEYVEGCG